MKLIATVLIATAAPAIAGKGLGTLPLPNVPAAAAIERIAANCTSNYKAIVARTDSEVVCDRPMNADAAATCQAAFFALHGCPDTAREVWRFSVVATASGSTVTYVHLIQKSIGQEKEYATTGKNGFEPQLRSIFPEAP